MSGMHGGEERGEAPAGYIENRWPSDNHILCRCFKVTSSSDEGKMCVLGVHQRFDVSAKSHLGK